MIRRKALALVVAAAVLLAGCSAPPDTHYYVLDPPPVTSGETLPETLAVRQLDVARPYADEPIAYRAGPVELRYYTYHRWAAAPGELVREALVTGLQRSGLFEEVWDYGSPAAAEYVLAGTLRAFEERDLDDRWEARLSLHLYVLEAATGTVAYSRHFDLSEPAHERSPCAVAEAMGRLTGRVVEAFANEFPTVVRPAETELMARHR